MAAMDIESPVTISPSTRRQVNLTNSSTAAPLSPSLANDDAREKRDRRRSRIVELQQRTISSPGTTSDRRLSLNSQNFTNAQLSDHYTSCIKLSAENKINAKNAFGLHLIDYMSELLAKKDSNFQVASSTLDASAKIYAGRVDAIHTETYKVLSGLSRGQSSQKPRDEDVDDNGGCEADDAADTGEPEKKKKRMRKSKTVETNLKNISVSKFDLEFEVDPFFQRTSATFDEGGTGGLLLNHLSCLNDSSQLTLDSTTLVHNSAGEDRSQRKTKHIDLRELRDVYAGVKWDSLQICPSFADFEFTNWSRESDDSVIPPPPVSKQHAFDMDAEPEPLPTEDTPSENLDGGVFYPLDMDNDDDNDAGSGGNGDDTVTVGRDGQQGHMTHPAVADMTHGTVSTLMQSLAAEPSEFSYFTSNLLKTWAGPEHWKVKVQKAETESTRRQRKDKTDAPEFCLFEDVDYSKYFKETKVPTMLTKRTLDIYSKTQATLPEDLRYEASSLLCNFIEPEIRVKRESSSLSPDPDNNNDYDYDNSKDRDNFCPAMTEADDDDDDDGGGGGGGFNLTSSSDHDLTQSQPDVPLSQDDSLVLQPKKVAKLDIGYAKTAKIMDVKRLKASMWKFLTKLPPPTPGPDGDHGDEPVTGGDKDQQSNVSSVSGGVNGIHSFNSLVSDLPRHIPRTMATNLSVPIAFVCLLHLANEKELKLLSDESMSDVIISQDKLTVNA